MSAFTKWWIQFVAIAFSAGMIQYFGWWKLMYEADITKISLLIMGIFVLATLTVGYICFKTKIGEYSWDKADIMEHYTYFAADSMVTLGMVGTITGFLLMLNTAFANLDINDIKNVQQAISNMAVGMSTALVTTLVGMVCSLLTRLQLMVYENSDV